MPFSMLDAALAAHDAGLCVVRVRDDGSKRPVGSWKHYQTERPDRAEVAAWFSHGHPGIGVICGAVSGDLEMLELEGRFIADGGSKRFTAAMKTAGLELLLKRLVNGLMVVSPSDGRHFYYRLIGQVDGNTKLAMRPSTQAELDADPKNRYQTLIETRGEGGFVVFPPSHGTVHITGRSWERRSGGVSAIPAITVAERAALFEVARSFNEATVGAEPVTPLPPAQRATVTRWHHGEVGGSWMDAVVEHLADTWTTKQLLEHYGWTYAYTDRHGRDLMTRPGKDEGVSGSINASDRLCVFSSSTPFAIGGTLKPTTYDRLDILAAYEHGGDRQAAARTVAEATGILAAWKRQHAPTITAPPPAPAPTGIDPATGEVAEPSGGLDEAFWTSRPVLEHIRQAARSRLVAPAAVLGAVMARVAAFTPPSTCLPAIIGGTAPLSTYVAFRGRSGAGKSSPAATATELLPDVPPGCVGPLALGSGEGLVEAFMELVEEEDGGGKKRKVKRQAHRGALFSLDEGQALAEMANRRGSTILPVLRTAWSGGDPGQANASIETRRSLRPGSYAVGLISLWQDKAASALLADSDGGTPQRFVWMPTDDPGATMNPPAWPGQLGWKPPPMIVVGGVVSHHPLEVHPDIRTEIIAARVADLRCEVETDALDAHRRLNKLKVAGVLAVLDERHAITLEDWDLAERIIQQSDSVRDWVLAEARRRLAAADVSVAEREAMRSEIVEESAAQRALGRAARAVHRAAMKAEGKPITRRMVHAAITSRDRQHVTVVEAIAEAERLQWVREVDHLGDVGWVIGDARPA